jgi:hypothetical protein
MLLRLLEPKMIAIHEGHCAFSHRFGILNATLGACKEPQQIMHAKHMQGVDGWGADHVDAASGRGAAESAHMDRLRWRHRS